MALSEELMAILACPACKGALLDGEEALLCTACRLKFPVREGIPVLLVEEAEKLS
jgi:uncharacterized protein